VEAHPGRSVAPEPKGALESQRADAGLLVGEPPDCPKPKSERQVAAVERCPTCGRDHGTAVATLPNPAGEKPGLGVSALRTSETVRPTDLDQVPPAVGLRSELPFKFKQIARIEPTHANTLY
jgi:hypothetical protein